VKDKALVTVLLNSGEYTPPNTSTDEEEEQPAETVITTPLINIPFSDFWNSYDRKTGDRERAERLWSKLKDEEREAIIAHVPLFKAAQPEKQFRPHPATYLHQRRWENEIVQDSAAPVIPQQTNSKFDNRW
jgi:hypothetical protein